MSVQGVLNSMIYPWFWDPIMILIYFERIYYRLSRYIKFVVLGPEITEKSYNENRLILPYFARGRGWVHSCRRRWENGGAHLLPSLLLDKSQSASFTPGSVFLPSLKEFSPEDRVQDKQA